MPTQRSSRQAAAAGGRWFSSATAASLLRAEQRALLPILASCFGKAALYLRPGEGVAPGLSGHMTLSLMSLYAGGEGFEGDLRCASDALPLADDSVQLVYALHVAELAEQPQAMLCELARVLAPEGLLVLLALNPASPFRLRWGGRVRGTATALRWRQRLLQAGLEPVRQLSVGPVLPWSGQEREREAAPAIDLAAPLRAARALVARKRRPGMTPLPARRRQVPFAAAAGPG